MNIVNFDVKFQSDSVNDGRGGIYTMILPVKYSSVVVTSFILRHTLKLSTYFTWPRLTTVSLDL